jgi:outer membrane protein OmpA-like peptidoglycan-associated protein
MRKRVNYVSLMFLFTLILGYNAQAQTIADRITKRDVQPKVERMPNIINTLLHDEYAPAISPDGRTLVYQSNAGGKTWEYYRLWQSMRDTVTGFWTKPSPIDEINGDFKQGDIYGGPSLSYDGKTLYFFAKMGEGSEDIYQSTKGADGKWGKPEKVAGAVNTGEYEGFPSISPDGMFLYFMRKKDGGSSSSNSGSAESDKGGSKTKYPSCYKLMVAKRKLDGSFGEPTELPSPIPGDCDKHVRILPDGQSLFFSSTRTWLSPKDSKDFDLYYSAMEPGGAWTAPVLTDMSPWVRTTMYSYQPDMLVSVAPNDNPHVLAYFSSYRGASHELFTYPLQERFKPKRTCWFTATVVDSATGAKLKPVVKVTNLTREPLSYEKYSEEGKFKTVLTESNKYRMVFELEDYEPVTKIVDLTKDISEWECSAMIKMRKKGVQATITVLDGLTNEIIAESNAEIKPDDANGKVSEFKKTGPGKFFALLNPGTTYTANGSADQYEPSSISLDLRNKVAGDTINREIYLFDLSKIVFQNINFNTARPRTMNEQELDASLLPKARQELDKVYKFMMDYPRIAIRIEAHTDDRGSDDYNQGLSERRAAAAKYYLTKIKGIPESRIEVRAFGEKSPMVPNNSPANWALNRRVEFKPQIKK